MVAQFDVVGDAADETALARLLVAVGLVGGDLTAPMVAHSAQVHLSVAERALAHAGRIGLVAADGTVEPGVAAELVAALTDDQTAAVHAAAARRLLGLGAGHAAAAVAHARAAGPAIPADELIDLSVHAGLSSLAVSDWAAAETLFRMAVDVGASNDRPIDTVHLRYLGLALTGLGNFSEAHAVLTRATEEAIRNDDWHEATSAAGQIVVPVEWHYGDKAVLGLLERISRMDLDVQTRIVLDSMRSMVESWVPFRVEGGQQFAWVSRSSLAQPMSERALRDAVGVEPETRMFALTAWRATHRAPRFLAQRRAVSAEALDLAQTLRFGYFQIEAATAAGVDALESGDRATYDRALAVARWVAEQNDVAWLTWRAHTLLAGCAHLDGDLAAARRHREIAAATGAEFAIPGTAAADTLLLVEEILDRDDVDEMAAFVVADDEPAVDHAIGRLALAYREARVGRPESAERSLRIALRQIDEEGSYLLVACRAVAVVWAMSDGTTLHPSVADLGPALLEILEPWSRHVAVDSFGFWCEGPVSLALAELHHLSGNPARARVLLSFATRTAREMYDVRAIARVDRLAALLAATPATPPGEGFGLTDRELAVLRGIVAGKTNPAIAVDLAFSLSTIRNDTTEIFRKLGVTKRRDAAAKAVAVGLVATD